jgi:Flp pilus assembly protein TadG
MSRSSGLARRRAVAGIEFAVPAPLLLLLVLGSSDLVMWMRTWLRMEQSASALAQVVTQYKALYASDFAGVFYPVAKASVGGAALACATGGMVVTGISNASGTPKVGWQWASGTCFTSAYASGTTPSLPGGYAPPSGLSVVVVELFTTKPAYVFSAGLMASTGLTSIHTYAVLMPRNGTLPTYTAGTRPS